MRRHQPPRVLCRGIIVGHPGERLAQRRERGAECVDLGLRRGGQCRARAEQEAVEAIDHRRVGQVGLDRRTHHRRAATGGDNSADQEHADQHRQHQPHHPDRIDHPDHDRRKHHQRNHHRDPLYRPPEPGIEPLPLAPRRIADRAVARVEPRRDIVKPRDCLGDSRVAHLLSIGVNGELAFSSLPWATPSARAI